MSACMLSFILMVPAVFSLQWLSKVTSPGISGTGSTVDIDRWIDLSATYGNCTCVTTQVSYCLEKADAFQATGFISIASVCLIVVIVLLLAYELALYGPYGGSHTFTRVQLILALMALGTQILTLFAWASAFLVQHCGDAAFFETTGSTLGWPFFVRIAEAVMMLVYTLYVVAQFSKSHRGPPGIPMLAALFLSAITAVTTVSRSWMYNDNTKENYGLFSSCVCPTAGGGFCNGGTLWTLSLVFGIISFILAFITAFFACLRCVDSEALTLRFATISGILALIAEIVTLMTAIISGSSQTSCGTSNSLNADGFLMGPPVGLVITAMICQLIFLVLNIFYSIGQNYRSYWWKHIKDARTKAHEARENEDDDEEDNDDEDDGEEAQQSEGSPLEKK